MIVNLSGYKFTKLINLESIQAKLQTTCQELGLKGTILLSIEGINVFVSCKPAVVALFSQCITNLVGEVELKESLSENVPFKKMLVKIKAEIITFGQPNIDPIEKPAPSISAEQLKEWLDAGKEVVILDARNNYEFDIGTFENAIHLNIENFKEFAQASQQLPIEYKTKPIVTFCTGGIRCEKAAPYLLSQGFEEVYQLDGGILKYLEKNGSAHYQGDCFVFDERVAVDAKLSQVEYNK